jgi:glycosyltransferase involved in cell wall biosynthesis
MQFSVIIPVFNAAPYITKAVKSALSQPETREILLIEDGSNDNSLKICQELAEKSIKIRLLVHPLGKNLGAGASRNLGVRNAICEYIAFLDADDFYLPDRFLMERSGFINPGVEGIYGGTGFHIYNDQAGLLYAKKGFKIDKITSVSADIPPQELPYLLLTCPKRRGQNGYFMLDALTVRRSVFKKAGYFNEELKVHQDTEWMIRLAMTCHIKTGEFSKPIAMRGIHENNRIVRVKNENKTRYFMYTNLLVWANTHCTKQDILRLIKQNKAVYQLLAENVSVTNHQRWQCLIKFPRLFWSPNTFRLLMNKNEGSPAGRTSVLLKTMLFAQRLLIYLRRRTYAVFKGR